jgi:hypothetical protein
MFSCRHTTGERKNSNSFARATIGTSPCLRAAVQSRRDDHLRVRYAEKNLSDANDFEFLSKPFTLKQLVTKVKETMAA